MSWRLDIGYETVYRYDRPVVASYNEARVTPLSAGRQRVGRADISVQPAAQLFTYTDYWGTLVHAFDVHAPHERLVVKSAATVETAGADGAGEDGGLSWDDMSTGPFSDRFYEFLAPSRLVGPTELAKRAEELRRGCGTPAEAAGRAVAWSRTQLEYGPGATTVGTTALEAWRAGRGVCQDFAHLSLAVLRAMGVPARYVSGYFYPRPEGVVGAELVGESHAWVEAWLGKWLPYDPTNGVAVGERHVVVARGRDYSDVPPLRGIYSGPPGSSTEVRVRMVRRA